MDKKKKILIYSTAYLPHIGGAEIAVKEITDRLGGVFDFDLITMNLLRNEAERERIGNVNVFRVNAPKFLFPFVAAWRGHMLNKVKKYDCVWAIMASYGGFAALFFKFLNHTVKFVLTLQEGDDPEYIKKKLGAFSVLWKEIMKRADVVQAISNFLANWARQNGARKSIVVVPNGVDVSLFEPKGVRVRNPALFGFSSDKQVLFSASRLVTKNGIEYIIRSLPLLPKNVVLAVAGSGVLLQNLKAIASDLALLDRLVFLGEITHAKLHIYLQSADIFIRPSLSEGMGNAFIEAMASGLPVIATAVGGIPDFLHDGQTGLVCQVKDPKSIALKVKELINDPSLRERLVNNAKAFIKGKYEWHNITKDMAKILDC